jgi:hypothetical protein
MADEGKIYSDYLEALSNNADPEVDVYKDHLQALTTSVPEGQVYSNYLQVLSRISNDATIFTDQLQALSQGTPDAKIYTGYIQVISTHMGDVVVPDVEIPVSDPVTIEEAANFYIVQYKFPVVGTRNRKARVYVAG